MAQQPILVPQKHGGAIQRGGTPGNPGGGRYPEKLKSKMLRRMEGAKGRSYDEIVDEIAQTATLEMVRLAAVKTACDIAQLDKEPQVVQSAKLIANNSVLLPRISEEFKAVLAEIQTVVDELTANDSTRRFDAYAWAHRLDLRGGLGQMAADVVNEVADEGDE